MPINTSREAMLTNYDFEYAPYQISILTQLLKILSNLSNFMYQKCEIVTFHLSNSLFFVFLTRLIYISLGRILLKVKLWVKQLEYSREK